MWICLNDSFLSIVADRDNADLLRVRARVAGDIERVFPLYEGNVEERPTNDYRFMACIPRELVARVLADRLQSIDYGNFKASVKERDRHTFYATVWSVLARFGAERLRRATASSSAPRLLPEEEGLWRR